MAELRVGRILLLMISLAKSLESTKLLAPLKKCGDLECETLISRVIAMRDYTGPDCRYLNFTEGEEISVYVKLSGEREDLWAGSKGKDFGFFPRDAVQIEEVFISEEVEISTKESDFLCLFEEGYIFGSENNELNSDNDEDANEQTYSIYDSDLQTEPGFDATSHSMLFEDQFSASEAPETTRGASESKDWGEGEAGDGKQEVNTAPPALRVPEGQGWFGLGTGQAEEKASEPVTEPLQESAFQRRKLAMEDEHDLEKLNGEPQTEHEQGPESELASEPLEFSSVQEERLELGWESEHIPKSQPSGWFGGGFTSYLGFGEENTGLELLSTESNPPLPDVPTAIPSAEEAQFPSTEVFTEKEEATVNDNSTLRPGWFDFGLGMLGFASANENKIISDDGKHEDDLTASEFDPEKDHETKMMKIMELEEEIDKELKLEKRDNSDSTPYLNFFYSFDNPWSFQNVPEETELKISRQIPDQKNIVENDETEKLSVKNPTDDTEDATILESRYSQSDMVSKMRIHEEINFETPSSKSDNEPSKSPAASEGPTLEASDGSGSEESALTDSWMVSQSQIPPKEDASDFHVLKCLFQTDCGFMAVAFSPIVILTEMLHLCGAFIQNPTI